MLCSASICSAGVRLSLERTIYHLLHTCSCKCLQVLLSWNVGTSIQWCILFAYNECGITHFAQSELSHFMWCFIAFFLLERNELTGTQNPHQMTAVITTVKEYSSQVCEHKWFKCLIVCVVVLEMYQFIMQHKFILAIARGALV